MSFKLHVHDIDPRDIEIILSNKRAKMTCLETNQYAYIANFVTGTALLT
jgi:hypothetical protein